MNRRLHEMEIELRRLENEREELSAAYKEAEAVSNQLYQKKKQKKFKLQWLNQKIYTHFWFL